MQASGKRAQTRRSPAAKVDKMLIQDGKLRHTNKAVVIQIPSHKHLCSHEHELIVMTHKAQTLDTLDVAGANQAAVEGVVVADQIPKARIAVTVLVKQAVEHAAQRGTRRRGGIGSRTADASATKAAKLTRISIVAGAVRGRMSKGHSHRHAGMCTAPSVSALPQQHQQTHEAEKEERCGEGLFRRPADRWMALRWPGRNSPLFKRKRTPATRCIPQLTFTAVHVDVFGAPVDILPLDPAIPNVPLALTCLVRYITLRGWV